MLLREKLVSVNFMVIVTDPRNESTREIIKVSCEVTDKASDPCDASTSRVSTASRLVKAFGIETDQATCVVNNSHREKKPLIVEVVASEKRQVIETTNDAEAKKR